MHQIDIALAAIGLLVILLGLCSEGVRRSVASQPILAVVSGIAFGPAMLGWLDIEHWGDSHAILEEATRVTLAIGLMAVALRLRRRELAQWWKPVALLLLVGMPVMFAVPSLLGWWLLGLPLVTAFLIAGALTPTDPVVASSIVTGNFAEKHLPPRVRATISLEAGANDGLAYLFMLAPIVAVTAASIPEAGERWLVDALLQGVLLGAILGIAAGYVCARALAWAEGHNLVGTYSFSVITVPLSLFALGAGRLAGTDELVAVFAAGIAFNLASGRADEDEEAHVQESVNRLFTLPAFMLFGMALPWAEWARTGWATLAAFAAACLLLRRLPLAPLLRPILGRAYSWRDCLYIAWFGPNGVAAIFYALYAVKQTGHEAVWPVASFVIFASILLHGFTATPFTRLYSRGLRFTPERAT